MTSFGRWLGEENGKEMLREILKDCTLEQARAAVTTYCVLFGIQVDTAEWDELIRMIRHWDVWFGDIDELDNYMVEFLV